MMSAKQESVAAATIEQQQQQASSTNQASETLASKFPPKFLEGVDFIETEEDAKAVEAATLKIQSTFRGKKFRLKGGPKVATGSSGASSAANDSKGDTQAAPEQKSSGAQKGAERPQTGAPAAKCGQAGEQDELSKRVGEMQVNDNEDFKQRESSGAGASAPEEEVERAATKIQAGFKGYKTRKELEGSKQASGGGGGGASCATSE